MSRLRSRLKYATATYIPAMVTLWDGNKSSLIPMNSPRKEPVMRSLDVFFDVSLSLLYNKNNGDSDLRRADIHVLLLSLPWRHNGDECVSNHQPYGCLLNRLFGRWSKKTSKLRITGLCMGNSPGPVNSPHKGPVTRKMFPFADVIMLMLWLHFRVCGAAAITTTSVLILQPTDSNELLTKQWSCSFFFIWSGSYSSKLSRNF